MVDAVAAPGGAVLLLLVVLFYAEEDWRGWNVWNHYRREWEAKGEKFDFGSFIPPPVPDDQNFALTPIVASCYGRYLDKSGHRLHPEDTNVVNRLEMKVGWEESTNDLGNWRKSEKINLASWQRCYRTPRHNASYTALTNEFPTAPDPQTSAAGVLLALSKYGSALEELRQVADQCRESRFPLNYESTSHDQSLHYHRTPDGKFLLYSVGWDEKDDGGTVALRPSGWVDTRQGDWVWPSSPLKVKTVK